MLSSQKCLSLCVVAVALFLSSTVHAERQSAQMSFGAVAPCTKVPITPASTVSSMSPAVQVALNANAAYEALTSALSVTPSVTPSTAPVTTPSVSPTAAPTRAPSASAPALTPIPAYSTVQSGGNSDASKQPFDTNQGKDAYTPSTSHATNTDDKTPTVSKEVSANANIGAGVGDKAGGNYGAGGAHGSYIRRV